MPVVKDQKLNVLASVMAVLGALLLSVFMAATLMHARSLEAKELANPEPQSAVPATNVPSANSIETPQASSTPETALGTLTKLLSRVEIVPNRVHAGGYDRSCSPGAACVFGEAWTDNNRTKFGRNGCDTRNDVLGRSLTNITFKPGTNNCTVLTGTLNDPYTGKTINFERGWNTSNAIEIDHLIPLAAAWDMGASNWSKQRRVDFANDVELVLITVDGPTNQAKSDRPPASWLPPNESFRCEYAERYLSASIAWNLPITAADHHTLSTLATTCD